MQGAKAAISLLLEHQLGRTAEAFVDGCHITLYRRSGDSVHIIFYKNGFTIDGGELRPWGVPENDKFDKDVREG